MDGRTDVNMRDGKTGEKVMRNKNQGEIFSYTTLGRLLLACCHTAGKEKKNSTTGHTATAIVRFHKLYLSFTAPHHNSTVKLSENIICCNLI